MKKRGQIYIVAAIILIAFLIGVVAISNTISRLETQNIEEESAELSYEIQKIFDTSSDDDERFERLIEFADDYSETSGAPIDFYFISSDFDTFGSNNLIVYDSSNKSTNIDEDTSVLNILPNEKVPKGKIGKKELEFDNGKQKITIETDDIDYEVPLGNSGFHYIISKDVKGERHILIK